MQTYVRPKHQQEITFGFVRAMGYDLAVTCLNCGHQTMIGRRQAEALRPRLPDDLELAQARHGFRCSECGVKSVTVDLSAPGSH